MARLYYSLLLWLMMVGPGSTARGRPAVETTFGRVVGFTRTNSSVDIWWNVPYAAPPVDDLRFRPPVDPQPWVSALDCTATPRMCPQNHDNKTHRYDGTEDCLVLHVYAPANRTAGQPPLPVMAFIHGGSYKRGSGYSLGVPIPDLDSLYDGEKLAVQNNVIVVTMNYRLAILGFLALQELAAEQADGTTGNYGLQDQRKALQWVQANIARFGGDPARVLLFGESAGGGSVCYHLTSPASRGLFASVLAESPVCTGRVPFSDLAVAQNFGSLWVDHFGCRRPTDAAATLACLRSLSTEEVLDFESGDQPGNGGGGGGVLPPNPPNAPPLPLLVPVVPWWPVVDGSERGVVARPLEMIRSGRFNDVPTAMGTNRNEGSVFILMVTQVMGPNVTLPLTRLGYDRTLLHFFENNRTTVDAIDAEYRRTATQLDVRLAEVLRDFLFTCPVRAVLRAINAQRRTKTRGTAASSSSSSYMYSFNRTLADFPLWDLFHDFHGAELFYVFDRPVPYLWEWTPDDHVLAQEMGSYWSAMAATGDPNPNPKPKEGDRRCPTCIQWPRYAATADGDGDDNIVLKHNLTVENGLFRDHCNFWDAIGYS